MKIFNIGILIPMHFCSFVSNRTTASYIKLRVSQVNVMYLMTYKLFPTLYCTIVFFFIHQMSLHKSKYIRMDFNDKNVDNRVMSMIIKTLQL